MLALELFELRGALGGESAELLGDSGLGVVLRLGQEFTTTRISRIVFSKSIDVRTDCAVAAMTEA